MSFELWDEAKYRSCGIDDLETRKAAIVAELKSSESEFGYDELQEQVRLYNDASNRIDMAAALERETRSYVANGAGKSVETPKAKEDVDPHDTVEYRKAFMDYAIRGKAIPMELRSVGTSTITGIYTQTTDVAPQVPTTMAKEIIRKMTEYGKIWAKVQKLAVKGGLWFRVVDLLPEAVWIDETKVSDEQKFDNDDKVSFSFFMLECRVSQSTLASAVTFDDFQAMFAPAIAEAMVRALEAAIISGTGNGQPLGITNDPRVTNVVTMSTKELADWTAWHTKVKAAMPKSYRDGEFIMAQGSWDKYIETLRDKDDHPVSQTGYNPVTGEEEYRLMGKPVDTVEDILPDFDSAAVGDVIAIFGKMDKYAVNTQPGMPLTTKRWVDEDQNKEKLKAQVALDGKVLDPHGFVLVKLGASA